MPLSRPHRHPGRLETLATGRGEQGPLEDAERKGLFEVEDARSDVRALELLGEALVGVAALAREAGAQGGLIRLEAVLARLEIETRQDALFFDQCAAVVRFDGSAGEGEERQA